jgi:putative transposase
VLRQAEASIPIDELLRKYGVSQATFCVWKKKYGGVGAVEARRVSQVEDECRPLKHLVLDLSLDKQMLQKVLAQTG